MQATFQSGDFPELLGDMRRYRVQQLKIGFKLILCHLAHAVKLVEQGHQSRNGRVEFHFFVVAADFFDGFVHHAFQLWTIACFISDDFLKLPDTVQVTLGALGAIFGPWRGFFIVPDKHDIGSQGIGAVFVDDIVGVDHVALGLGHFFTV